MEPVNQHQGDPVDADDMPTSFGVFKPVGYVMMGLPTQAQSLALESVLHDAGWLNGAVRHFTPRETVADLEAMIENAGPLAGFGYELTLLRRYLALTRQGYRWLLVKAGDAEHAAQAAELARQNGATLAVHYRTLVVEQLIEESASPAPT